MTTGGSPGFSTGVPGCGTISGGVTGISGVAGCFGAGVAGRSGGIGGSSF